MPSAERSRREYPVETAQRSSKRVSAPPPAVTLPMPVSLGSVQLRCEAVAARCWPGSRAACFISSVTASRQLQIASRGLRNSSAATAVPLRLRHAGPAAQLTPINVRPTK